MEVRICTLPFCWSDYALNMLFAFLKECLCQAIRLRFSIWRFAFCLFLWAFWLMGSSFIVSSELNFTVGLYISLQWMYKRSVKFNKISIILIARCSWFTLNSNGKLLTNSFLLIVWEISKIEERGLKLPIWKNKKYGHLGESRDLWRGKKKAPKD